MSSIRAKIVRAVTRAYLRRVDVESVDIDKVRRLWNRVGGLLPVASGVQVEADEIAGLRAEWLTPRDSRSDGLLLYLHGGGYVVGGCDMHRQMVSHIARAGRLRALLPEYRLSPEHKYPAAIDDAVAVYRSVLQTGVDAGDIVFAGDSAGGGLTVATLIALRDAGERLPAAAVLLSPFLDVTGSGRSMQTRADRDPWFRPQDVAVVAGHYCQAHEQRLPMVSPVFADVDGLPPVYIQVGDDEILLSDSERLAEKYTAAGIDVELDIWPEMWHVFQAFIGKMPESRQAIDRIGDYIQSRLSRTSERSGSSFVN